MIDRIRFSFIYFFTIRVFIRLTGHRIQYLQHFKTPLALFTIITMLITLTILNILALPTILTMLTVLTLLTILNTYTTPTIHNKMYNEQSKLINIYIAIQHTIQEARTINKTRITMIKLDD